MIVQSAAVASAPPRAPHVVRLLTAETLFESLVVLVAGFSLMMFLYSGTGGESGDRITVPAHDSWYHTKMAVLLPQVGILYDLPWLAYAYFDPFPDTVDDHAFVSHHFGFHVLLVPFVYLSKWLTGDYLLGAKWGIATFFGGMLVTLNLLLIHVGMRWRWLWLALFVLLPHQFFLRHAYVRAIAPSLMLMLIIVLCLFRERPILAGLAVAAYNMLYLGSIVFSALIVATYVASCVVGPREDRRFPWKILIATIAGWFLGLFLYPYRAGVFDFLYMQIFQTGLNPDIEVGQEWKAYEGVWWFAQMSGALLIVWAGAVALRFRFGPRLSAEDATLLLLNFGFLVLTFKARRFIEYWPAFGLLSAAYLAAPLLNRFSDWWRANWDRCEDDMRLIRVIVLISGILVAATFLFLFRNHPYFGALRTADEYLWLRELLGSRWLWLAAGVTSLWWLLRAVWRPGDQSALKFTDRGLTALLLVLIALDVATAVGGPALRQTRRDLRSNYNVAEVEKMMDFLRSDSQPGDIIFTDDWDEFGLYFYHNTHNYFIVGLDPKFTHARKPDLWERFVKITRGQAPAEVTVEVPTFENGEVSYQKEKISVRLEDIREHFKAKYVIADRGHRPLRRQLAKATDFAELVYPCNRLDDCDDQPFLVFRIKPTGVVESDGQRIARLAPQGLLALSDLKPKPVTGDARQFRVDESVLGGYIRAGAETHLRGLSLKPGCTVQFEVPDGFETLEATLGAIVPAGAEPLTLRVFSGDSLIFEQTTGPIAAGIPVAAPLTPGATTLRFECTGPANAEAALELGSPRLVKPAR